MKHILLAAMLGALVTAGAAQARDTRSTEAAIHWRGLAEADGRFALALIENNHPGAVAEVGDEDFQAQLRTARRHFDERLSKVENFEGYSALMAGMATDFRDGHIWSRPSMQPGAVNWTGLVLGRRGGTWTVVGQEAEPGDPALKGARLESCDGEAAETWAATRIGLFRADATVEAQLAKAGSWLLLDSGNPFLKRPETCVFHGADGQRQTVDLRWRRESLETIGRAFGAAETRASVGLAIDQVGDGYWISLGTLGDGAAELAARVEAQADDLRRAPWVVVDLRGNGGGNSSLSDRITRALVGAKVIEANRRAVSCGGAFYRASADNISALRAWQERIRVDRGDEGAAEWASMVADMQAAKDDGRTFWPELTQCAEAATPAVTRVERSDGGVSGSLMTGRLVIVTDRYCFSSCLMAVDLFRRVGAVQVGEATDVSTRYMEVRTVTLPSRLRNFSTLMKLARGASDFGPYTPDHAYAGDLSDTMAVKTWVIDEVLAH